MAYYDSYSALVSAVSEVAEDDSQEFLDYIPKSIELAQLRLMDEIDLNQLNTQIELTCVANNRLLLKPSGYRFTNNVFITTSTGREDLLKPASADYLRDYWPVATSVGTPKYVATDYNSDYLFVAPTPASAYLLRADVRLDTTFISAANPTNYFTQYCGNALFYATMVQQSIFSKNTEAKEIWEKDYLNAIQGVNNRGRRDRRQDGGTASTDESGKNTLLGTK